MKHIWKIHALLGGPECVKVEADTDTKGKDVSTSSSNVHAKDKHVSDFGGLYKKRPLIRVLDSWPAGQIWPSRWTREVTRRIVCEIMIAMKEHNAMHNLLLPVVPSEIFYVK